MPITNSNKRIELLRVQEGK